MHTHKKIADK